MNVFRGAIAQTNIYPINVAPHNVVLHRRLILVKDGKLKGGKPPDFFPRNVIM